MATTVVRNDSNHTMVAEHSPASATQCKQAHKDEETQADEDLEKNYRDEVDEKVDPFLVDWDGEDDPANPRNWSRSRKWAISAVGIGFCGIVSISVSGYAIGLGTLQNELGVNHELANLGITVFTITFGVGGLVLAPLSETFGRNMIYISSAFLFSICFLPQALAQDIATLLVFRTLGGIGASTGVALSAGTLADVWDAKDRSLPMGLFSFSAFCLTGVGPTFFGWVEQVYSFRVIAWIIFALSGAFAVGVVLALAGRETRATVLLSRKAARLRKETGDKRYYAKSEENRPTIAALLKFSLTRPFRLFFTELVLFLFSLWLLVAWGILYVFLSSIPLVYTRVYHFGPGKQGLVFVSQIVGSVLGLTLNTFCDRLYDKNVERKGPEARLYIAMISGLLLPLGVFQYTWTSYASIPPEVSMIGIGIAYAALYGIYTSVFNYVSDSYTFYASSALSALNAVRNVGASFFPLFTIQMYDAMGIQAGGSMLGGLCAFLGLIPFVMFHFGGRLRSKSPYGKEMAARARFLSSATPST
ncbi:MFS general substrate transporter [Atractiella rhizophila]|nr:MFS general substrate transporter [Atractiella rhizophila]